jgi:2',3'-cyclic-nucleotide 2'-phosphodiesterase (5'-nucleotidase family)
MKKANAEIYFVKNITSDFWSLSPGRYLSLFLNSLLPGILAFIIFFGFTSFNIKSDGTADDGKLEVDIVQVNDVYEISPLQNDSIGGMARVASLKKQVQEKNLNTLLVMAGDFASPSIYNTVEINNKNVGGIQMIEAMNAANFDLAIFGNHEFDLKEKQLQACLDESGFDWVASNTFQYTDSTRTITNPFKKNNKELRETYVRTFTDEDGTTATIGFFGVTINSNKAANYVSYDTSFATEERLYNKLKTSCDAVIAITHQSMESDIILAKKLPGLAMIIGGHEHDMQFKKVGNVFITKAHANAKTAFLTRVIVDKPGGKVIVIPTLIDLDISIPKDPLTDYLVQRWKENAYNYFRSSGFNPDSIVIKTGESLDGRDEKIRRERTNLSRIIGEAMRKAYKDTTAIAMYNAGSIRVDDIVKPPVKEIDILKILPYPGIVYKVKMDSALLVKTLNTGIAKQGEGGFLQYSETLEKRNDQWFFKTKPVSNKDNFTVAIAEYLVKVGGDNFIFLKDIPTLNTDTLVDIRHAVIRYLRKKGMEK